MIKIFVLFSLMTILSSEKATAQTQDSTLNALLAINETLFINKPLDSLIYVLPSDSIEMKIFGHSKTARKVSILYPNRVWIELHVREFTHMNPADPNRVWNISQMRKEKLFKTVIYQKNTCYRNCDVR